MEKDDLNIYPNRDRMVKDLIQNHRLKGLSYTQLIDLIGEPEKYLPQTPNTAIYNLITKYGADIDPIYLKNLEVKFNADSIVTDVIIIEINH